MRSSCFSRIKLVGVVRTRDFFPWLLFEEQSVASPFIWVAAHQNLLASVSFDTLLLGGSPAESTVYCAVRAAVLAAICGPRVGLVGLALG